MTDFQPKSRIEELFCDDELIARALGEGVRAALLRHKRAGNPIAIWRDGKVVLLSPDEIPISDDDA